MVEVSTSKQIEGILNCLNALRGEARALGARELARLIGIAALAAEDGISRDAQATGHRESELIRPLPAQEEGRGENPSYMALSSHGEAPHPTNTLTGFPPLQVVDGGRR